jgi:hypothetical protein
MVVRVRGNRFDRIVVSMTDLLALTGYSALDELSAIVEGDSEADM